MQKQYLNNISLNTSQDRNEQISQWLEIVFPNNVPKFEAASADASFRRFFRLTFADNSTKILMDAPPDKENCQPFILVSDLLLKADILSPQIFQIDLQNGFLVLSDLGKIGLMLALNLQEDNYEKSLLMHPVLEILLKLQKSSKAGILPPYDAKMLRRELNLFPEWFLQKHLNFALSDKEAQDLNAVFELLIQNAVQQPKVFVHRDFMPRNIMLSESDDLNPAVIDFQDAVYGPITYDLVSLFRDAFLSWDEEIELDFVIRFWEKAKNQNLPVRKDFGFFWKEYELMGLQRHLKVLGIFCRLNYRDHKENYIKDLPRFIRYAMKTSHRYGELRNLYALLLKINEKYFHLDVAEIINSGSKFQNLDFDSYMEYV